VAGLASHTTAGLDAVRVVRAMKPSFASLATHNENGALTITGRALPPDAALVAELAPAFVAPRPPDVAGYLRCLGDLLGAGIRLCPQFGLNVHGKELYIVPFDVTDIRVITGRNVPRRLIAFVANNQQAGAERQPGGPVALGLSLDGQPVGIGPDGTFSVTSERAPGSPARLVLETAVGDATAVQLP